MPRATPLPPDERRAAILAATEPLLERYGRDVSTRQIAEAAGIAEGTIFRVFPSKDVLIEAVAAEAFDMQLTSAEIAQIEPGLELEERLRLAVVVLLRRMRRLIALLHALRLRPPPAEHFSRHREDSEILTTALIGVIGPDRDRLRVPVEEAAHLIRCLSFATTHPVLAAEFDYSPDVLVDRLLHGVLA